MKKQLIKNIFSVSGVQLANYILPLITIPYVVRVIGPANYGLINFAQAFVGYFALLINYGFELTATREIARNKEDRGVLSDIFWMILSAKVILFIFSTIIFAGSLLYFQKLQIDPRLYVLSYLCNIGLVFFPTWFFQGIEELSKMAIFNLIIKLIFTVLIFMLIHQSSDYYFYPVCLFIGQIAVGFFALWYAVKLKHLSLPNFKMAGIIKVLREGAVVFITTVVINIYTLSNIVLLGFIASDMEVCYFSSAYKLISIIMAITITPITQTLYPHLGGLFSNSSMSKSEKSYILLRVSLVMGVLMLLVSMAIYIVAPLVVTLLFGKNYSPAISSLRIMSFLPFIIGLSNVFGLQGMLNLSLDKEFFMITAMGATLCIILNFILIPYYSQIGTSTAWLATELFITLATLIVLQYHGYEILTKNNFVRMIENRHW
jgi:PST family polysaccharide transporter